MKIEKQRLEVCVSKLTIDLQKLEKEKEEITSTAETLQKDVDVVVQRWEDHTFALEQVEETFRVCLAEWRESENHLKEQVKIGEESWRR